MRRYLFLLVSFCTMAVAAIVYLRPTPALRFEGELAMLTPEDALLRLNAEAGRLTFTDNLALAHSQLALASGDFATAEKALDDVRNRDGMNALVEDQLSEIARTSGDLDKAIQHLSNAYQLEPTADRRQTLGLWHRIQRNAAAETAILQSVAPRKLSEWEVGRLAQLLTRAGRHDDLEGLFRTAAEWEGDEADVYRARLIDLLAEDGRRAEATATALGWFEKSKPDTRPLEIAIPALIDRGDVESAYFLARQSLSSAPETFHVLVPLFSRSGHRAIALELQGRWLRAAGLISSDQWLTIVDLASTTGDLRGLRAALAVTRRDEIEPHVLDAALRQFLRFQGASALAPYGQLMTADFLDAAPLIGAAWMSVQGRADATASYLAAASLQPMIDWDRQIWAHIASGIRGTPGYLALLEGAAVDDGLRASLASNFISPPEPAPSE